RSRPRRASDEVGEGAQIVPVRSPRQVRPRRRRGGMDDPYYRGDRDPRGGGGYPPRERERRGGGSRPPPYDEYRPSSGRPQQQGRDPSVAGDASYGGGHRHRDRRHSRRQREVMEP
ncbi:hypothetical protein THAOC_22152, partial [Thalassiosira oceanica]